jgi:glycosyltransferase involved in cell wall biosynthesis
MNVGGPALQVAALHTLEGFETLNVYGRCGVDEAEDNNALHAIREGGIYIPALRREIKPFHDFRAFIEIRKQIRKWKPDIVHTHTAKAGILGRIAARLEGVPVIIHTYHGHTFKHYFAPLQHRLFLQLERFLARISTRLIAISNSQQVEINEVYGVGNANRTVVIPLGLELRRFQHQAEEWSFANNDTSEIQITWCGRLVPVKNPTLAIQVAERLRHDASMPRWKMIIAGDGSMRKELEAMIAAYALEDRVTMVSWQKDMASLWASSSIALQTSLNEGTPVSLIEAMASGVPVVSTDVGGIQEICGAAALLANSGDAEGLASHIGRIIADPALRKAMSDVGRQRARNFSKERLQQDLITFYNGLLLKKKE